MRILVQSLCIVGVSAVLIGCAQRGSDVPSTSSVNVTPAAFNSAGSPTVEFTVPDMMCPEGCGEKVKEILSQQPGAKDVLVEFDTKTVTVAVDKDKFDAKQAIAALVDHQFNHSALKDATAAVADPKPQPADPKSVQ